MIEVLRDIALSSFFVLVSAGCILITIVSIIGVFEALRDHYRSKKG